MLTKNKVLIVFLAFFGALAAAGAIRAAVLTRAEANLLAAMNNARVSYGLPPLRADATLRRAARAHSAAMLRSGVFTHGSFAERMRAFGARAPRVGENLAWGVGDYAAAGTVVREWLASPGHRANLLRRGYTRVGVGALRGSFAGWTGALVVTADFSGH